MATQIEAGDVLVRAGVVRVAGYNYNVLPKISGEEYNHAGIAINTFDVHHVEANGFETIPIKSFFSCDNAKKGAVFRFFGLFDFEIRKRAARVAEKALYKKRKGNPFSTSQDLKTINCNEFVFLIFKKAISDWMIELGLKNDPREAQVRREYAGKQLLPPNVVRFGVPFSGASSVVMEAEKRAAADLSSQDVVARFEGRTYCVSRVKWTNICLWSELALEAFTPDSFMKSHFFNRVERRKCG